MKTLNIELNENTLPIWLYGSYLKFFSSLENTKLVNLFESAHQIVSIIYSFYLIQIKYNFLKENILYNNQIESMMLCISFLKSLRE